MASTSESTAPEIAAQLKEKANALYAAKSFSDSASLYTRILADFQSESAPDFIRRVYINRSACFIELEQYRAAMNDIYHGLRMTHSEPETDRITQKAHYRLARCLYEIGRYGDAIKELDTYRDIVGKDVQSELESTLRSRILQAIVDRDEKQARSAANPILAALSLQRRSLRYEVQVHDKMPGGSTITYLYDVPAALCIPDPPEVPTRLFLVQLVKKYHDDVMKHKRWRCWRCSGLAVSLVHTPASYLHMAQPVVIDYAQPVCQNGGVCDRAAREMMKAEMKLVADLGKNARYH